MYVVYLGQLMRDYGNYYMGLNTRKLVLGGLRATKMQTCSLRRSVQSDPAPLLFAYWKVSYQNLLQAKNYYYS